MITIIAGTNRMDSYTLKVAKEYQRILAEKGLGVKLFSLEGVNLMERNEDFQAETFLKVRLLSQRPLNRSRQIIRVRSKLGQHTIPQSI